MKLCKVKKIIVITALTCAITLPSIVAYAKSATTSHEGVQVTNTLNCTWRLTGNDDANATTSWVGKTGHIIGVRLHYRLKSGVAYTFIDGAVDPKSKTVYGSKSGVWDFLSEHYVYHVNSNGVPTETFVQTSLTDW